MQETCKNEKSDLYLYQQLIITHAKKHLTMTSATQNKKTSYQIQAIRKEFKNSITFEALNLENDAPVNIEIEKDTLSDFFNGNCPAENWLHNISFRENILDAAEILVRNRANGVIITEPTLKGWNIRTVYGKVDFISIAEYGAKFIEALQNSMAVLSTEEVWN